MWCRPAIHIIDRETTVREMVGRLALDIMSVVIKSKQTRDHLLLYHSTGGNKIPSEAGSHMIRY